MGNKYIQGDLFIDGELTVIGKYSEGLEYTLKDNDEYEVSGIGTCTDTDIVIPSTYNNLPVTTIDHHAFRNCSSLTSVTIPDSVTSIGIGAFYGCTSLMSVTIGNGVTSIGNSAFYDCSNMVSITFGNSVTTIDGAAFRNCSSLTSITLPDSIISIGGFVFYDCSSLTSVTLGDLVNTIGEAAFQGCSSLTSITIPSSVTTLGHTAFFGCRNLTSITIPCSVINIGQQTFFNCSKLLDVTIPDGVASIGYFAFAYCDNLKSIMIPSSVVTIDDSAFEGSKKLTIYCEAESKPEGWHVDWNSDNHQVVWGAALDFADVNEKLADKVDKVEGKGLSTNDYTTAEKNKLAGLATVATSGSYNDLTDKPDIPTKVSELTNDSKYVTEDAINGKYSEGLSYTLKKDGAYEVKGIGSCTDTEIIIPLLYNGKYVVGIGNYAFRDCSGLTSFTIPDSITSIGVSAFEGCSSLTSVTIPDSVTTIGWGAFYNCTGLRNITIGKSITSIGHNAFNGCTAVENIYFNAIEMADVDFTYLIFGKVGQNSRGVSVVIGKNVTKIPAYLFDFYGEMAEYAANITNIEFEKTSVCTSIGESAFAGIKSLIHINIPNSVTTLASGPFLGCDNLESITIPNNVTNNGVGTCRECPLVTIYCEAESQPEGWHWDWNFENYPVVWGADVDRMVEKLSSKELYLYSSTAGSTKKFKITVDDSGTITATEVV